MASGPVAHLDRLEPRTLMTAYISEDLASAFGLDETVYSLTPPAGGGVDVFGFGDSVAALGDIDGDGRPDFAVGAPGRAAINGDEASPAINGRVFIYSGADASVIRVLGGDFYGFGHALANVGDLNGDGVSDLLVGSPNYVSDALVETARGRITVFSGADGAELFSVDGDTGSAEFGFALGAAGDLNNDDVTDLLVGAPGGGSAGEGQAFVLSGMDGSMIFTFSGEHAGDRFGAAVAGGADIGTVEEAYTLPTYDGLADIVIGAPGYDGGGTLTNVGAVFVYSGDGTLRAELIGNALGGNPGDAFGSSVAIISGTTVAAGAPGWDQDGLGGGATDRGRVFLYYISSYPYPGNENEFYRGQDYHLVGQAAGERFGQSISTVADLNTASIHWLAITAPGGENGGTSYLAVVENHLAGSGILESTPSVRGHAIAPVGDVNGDGIYDFITGGPGATAVPSASVVPIFAMIQPAVINGSSNSGEFLFANPTFSSYGYYTSGPARLSQGYVIMNGVYTPLSELPGLGENVRISGINDSGDIIGYDLETPDPNYPQGVVQGDPFVWRDGEKHYLADLITNIIGPTDLNIDGIYFKRLGNNGDILFEENPQEYVWGVPRAWHLRGNTLRHLWSGYVEDVSDSGTVLGTEREGGGLTGESRTWTVTGGAVHIDNFYNAIDINNDGTILGTDRHGDLALFSNGEIIVIGDADEMFDNQYYAGWRVFGLDEEGRALAYLEVYANAPPFSTRTLYLYDNERGLIPLGDLIATGDAPDGVIEGSPLSFIVPQVIRVTDLGNIVFSTHVLTLADDRPGFLVDEGGIGSVAAGPGGIIVTAMNQSGLPISFFLPAGSSQWEGRVMSGLSTSLSPDGDIATFVDPKDGKTYAVVLGDDAVTLYVQDVTGAFTSPRILSSEGLESTIITGKLVVFVATDQRVHIGGLNGDGDLVIFYQPGTFNENTQQYDYFFDNISDTHLALNDFETPNWVGDLTVYVTPWNGMNIAGLDDQGDIHVVWWAPGLTNWQEENLSETSGAPTLVGDLTAYVTPWGGLNLAGTDASGDLNVTWWVPGFGDRWEHENMTETHGGVQFEPGSLTSYVTPWGGLNLAGISKNSGEVSVYWWTPTTNIWISESLNLDSAPTDPAPIGKLISLISGATLNLFGAGEDGDAIRMFWNPGDGGQWHYQNLTDEVSAS
ncbi:MAG: FG-GAP repeat protein [Phycisphaerales bacterium]|nr:FG-GAP repeat protein [Phycisphaerales bacterium]